MRALVFGVLAPPRPMHTGRALLQIESAFLPYEGFAQYPWQQQADGTRHVQFGTPYRNWE